MSFFEGFQLEHVDVGTATLRLRHGGSGHGRAAPARAPTDAHHAVDGHAERLVVLDGLPITEHFERCDDRFAAAWWHWFFFAQTEKPAEAIINRDPDAWYRADPAKLGPENYADWWRAVHTPEVVFAMVGEYRAGANVDRYDEAADRAAGATPAVDGRCRRPRDCTGRALAQGG